MRELIGSEVEFVFDSEGFGPDKPVIATVVGVERELVYVRHKGSDKVKRINKTKIATFEPVGEEPEFIPLQILSCENTSIGCPGVQYVKDGEGFNREDFEAFTGSCPCKCETCKCHSNGELRSANPKLVKAMIAGTIYGDYPQKERHE